MWVTLNNCYCRIDSSHGCKRAVSTKEGATPARITINTYHANVSAASLLLNCHIHAHHPQLTMGNAQSQNPSSHRERIQKLPGKIAAKLPAVNPLGRAKDSGYRSGSASSSGTAVKGGRTNDQTSATGASTGSDKGTPRPEAAPAAAERRSDAPAPVTESVRRNHAIYGRKD